MFTNTAIKQATTDLDRELYRRVCMLVLHICELPDMNGLSLDCHSIHRAISMAIPELKLTIGVYYGIEWVPGSEQTEYHPIACLHSWLVTPDGAVIDSYPVGFLTHNPVLCAGKGEYAVFGSGPYRPLEKETVEISSDQKVLAESQILFDLIKKGNIGHEADGVLSIQV